ncbi:MAG TPA: tannase/feruloyl esterase family alpha/beta hydrolase [Gemmatimonadaceae bacterium]|nr:tannase/feruloyl esterase family alpha/beta hydrolase [Gemmatimonadaceae bacterium]
MIGILPKFLRRSFGVFVYAVLFAILAPAIHAQGVAVLPPASGECTGLRNLRLADVRLTEVADIADSLEHGDNVRAPHCRVSGVIGRSTAFTAMLPKRWNKRMLMGGNGGYAGTINRGILANATAGYLTVSTNTGHDRSPGGGARWALNDPERQVDFGYLAVHRTAETGKLLAKAFYGAEPSYSYFTGCSNGGRQALMEAERFPEDFDGIVSGAPAAHMSRTGASFLKNTQAAFPDPSYFDHPLITQANLDLVSARVLEACDALDGVKDGILDDPRDCKFRLASIRKCPGDKAAADCLTVAQRAAIARIYAPTKDDRGKVVYPGQPFGGENLPGGWSNWITGRDAALMRQLHVPAAQAMFVTEGAKYFLFSDSTWDYSRYKGSLVKDSKRWVAMLDADNPDLSRFAKRKGKLVLWHGWSDPGLNPLATVDYYKQVLARDPRAGEYVRLFMAPGVLHCGGGPGPSDVSWLKVVSDWVENAKVPEQVIASRTDSIGHPISTRPWCAYPRRAAYAGKGSINDASSFVCRAPK